MLCVTGVIIGLGWWPAGPIWSNNAARRKNQTHGILARNLVPTCPHADRFSKVGRIWLAGQDLPADEPRRDRHDVA